MGMSVTSMRVGGVRLTHRLRKRFLSVCRDSRGATAGWQGSARERSGAFRIAARGPPQLGQDPTYTASNVSLVAPDAYGTQRTRSPN